MAFRFGVFDEISLEDLKKKQTSKSTKKATNFGVKVLKDFIKETNYPLPPDGYIILLRRRTCGLTYAFLRFM